MANKKQNTDSITTINLPPNIKGRAKKASKKMFGRVNLSGYIQVLINKDCDEKGIDV